MHPSHFLFCFAFAFAFAFSRGIDSLAVSDWYVIGFFFWCLFFGKQALALMVDKEEEEEG